MTLHLYFAKRFAITFFFVFSAFFVMLATFEFIELASSTRSETLGFNGALLLSFLKAPSVVHGFLPVITILTSLALFLRLARTSELVVTRAAGRSALRAVAGPLLTAISIGLFAIAVMNPINAATIKQYTFLLDQIDNRGSVFSIGPEGLWLREGRPDGQTVIYARGVDDSGRQLRQVSVFEFDQNGVATSRLVAKSATLSDGVWTLADGKGWNLDIRKKPEKNSYLFASMLLPSELTLEKIRQGFGEPKEISIWDTQSFIDRVERAGFAAIRHRVHFQMELALPLLMAGMVLVGAGLTLRHARFGRQGIVVLTTVLMGLGVYLLRNFTQILGENSAIPPLFAAWAPPAIAIFLALGLLLHMEDG
jgi:lipopolysaccharide export system permease protein